MVNGYSIKEARMGGEYTVIPSPQQRDADKVLANAAFIVRAVNRDHAFEALLAACKQVALYAGVNHGTKSKDYGQVVAKAIALAEGKGE